MTPDLLTLSVIRHEDTVHLVSRLPLQRSQSTVDIKPIPSVQVVECPPPNDTENTTATTTTTMGNPNDARTRALASMYGTSFVFTQNQKNLIQALPWGRRNSSPHNPVPSSDDMQRMVSKMVEGRGNGRKEVADRQVSGLQSERVKKEHAASLFALLT